MLDRKGARHVDYLLTGMDYGVHAVAGDSGQTQETQKIEEE